MTRNAVVTGTPTKPNRKGTTKRIMEPLILFFTGIFILAGRGANTKNPFGSAPEITKQINRTPRESEYSHSSNFGGFGPSWILKFKQLYP